MDQSTLGRIIVRMLVNEYPEVCHLLTLDHDKQLLVAEAIDYKIAEYDPTAMP